MQIWYKLLTNLFTTVKFELNIRQTVSNDPNYVNDFNWCLNNVVPAALRLFGLTKKTTLKALPNTFIPPNPDRPFTRTAHVQQRRNSVATNAKWINLSTTKTKIKSPPLSAVGPSWPVSAGNAPAIIHHVNGDLFVSTARLYHHTLSHSQVPPRKDPEDTVPTLHKRRWFCLQTKTVC